MAIVSFPLKILVLVLGIPQLHVGTQSRDMVGNAVEVNSEVLEEWSLCVVVDQACVVALNSATWDGAKLFKSLPPRAKIRLPERMVAW